MFSLPVEVFRTDISENYTLISNINTLVQKRYTTLNATKGSRSKGCSINKNLLPKTKAMKAKIAILVLSMSIGFALSASAQTVTPKINSKQRVQKARIAQGVASGSLTPVEAKGLRMQQRHINRVERRAKADGVVTRKEHAVISRKQRNASRQIRKQKND
jgi:hypothetical protein